MRAFVAALCLTSIACWVGCRGKASPEPRTYQARGVVQHIPDKGPPSLVVRHEAIDYFVHSDGVAAGMHAMTMTLQVDDKISIARLKTGDKIAFVLDVNWDRTPPLLITKLRKLPAETKLVFRKARSKQAKP